MKQREIFIEALQKEDEGERAAFLDAACGDDVELHQTIEELLAEHQNQASFFLDAPPPGLGKTVHMPAVTEQPGTVIGPYKLLQQIGEGGMGVVYMAEQAEPIERRVALKIIKPGMDTRQVIARFEAERQALAMMDHPNIAKVFDAGTTDTGRPYFVMELVRGIPITQYCDEHQLSPRARLELFLPACQAVQHAHQKGIIHRDIKPSNVMVADYDDRPVPKIIDFGVAKAVEQRLTEKTLFTEFGQVVGTMEYMSPEQAKLNQQDVDTRSDIYSLGVLLYELLAGETPFDGKRLRSAAFDELLRIIREEEPPRPSQRLSTSQSLSSIAANRQIEPKQLSSLVHGELDWIVMKALEKDRTRRYETANGFSRDIQRYLNDEPVTACPPSAAYRFHKFARRNKPVIATTAAIAAALIIGTSLATWQAIQARQAEQEALKNLKTANAEQERADENFRRAKQAVDDFLVLVSESTLLEEEGMQPLRQDLLDTALEYYQDFVKQEAGVSNLQAEVAATHYRIARMQAYAGKANWTEPYHASLDIIEEMLADENQTSWGSFAEGIPNFIGIDDIHLPDRQAAIDAIERGLRVFSDLTETHPEVESFKCELASTHYFAGHIYSLANDSKNANVHFRSAQHNWEALVVNREDPNPEYANYLADVYGSLSRVLAGSNPAERGSLRRQGVATLRAAYGNSSVALANMLRLEDDADTNEESISISQEVIAIYEKALADEGVSPRSLPGIRWSLGRAREMLALRYEKAKRMEDAHNEWLKAINAFEVLAAQSPRNRQYRLSLSSALQHLGNHYHQRGQNDKALREYDRSLELGVSLLKQDGATVEMTEALGETVSLHASLVFDEDRRREVIADYSRMIELEPDNAWPYLARCNLYRSTRQDDHAQEDFSRVVELMPENWRLRCMRADFLRESGRHQEAIVEYEKLIELDSSKLQFYVHRAVCFQELEQHEQAIESLNQALTIDPGSAWAYKHRGDVYENQGEFEKAVTDYEKAFGLDASDHIDLFTKLINCYTRLGKRDEAIEQLNRLIESDKYHAQLWHKRGDMHYFLGQHSQAIKDYSQALELNPHLMWSRLNRGYSYAILGQREKAVKDYQVTLELDTYDEQFNFVRGERLLEIEQYEQALKDFERAIELEPTWTHYRKRAALAHFHLAQFDEALADLRVRVESKPDDTSTLFWIDPKLVAQCPDEAFKRGLLQLAAEAVERSNNPAAIRVAQIDLMLALGQYDLAKAIEALSQAIQLNPKLWSLYYKLALLQLSAGHIEDYRKTCGTMSEVVSQTEDPEAAGFAAWTATLAPHAIEDFSPVIALARGAVEANPENQMFQKTLGAILLRSGQTEAAIAQFTEVAEREASDTEPKNTSPAYLKYFLAIANQTTGNEAQAREYLTKANQWMENELADKEKPPAWNRQATLEILRQEAESLIELEENQKVKPEDKPQESIENKPDEDNANR